MGPIVYICLEFLQDILIASCAFYITAEVCLNNIFHGSDELCDGAKQAGKFGGNG